MNILYNLGIRGFKAGMRLGALRSVKLRKQLSGQRETQQRIADALAARSRDGFDYWFHAASLGEFEQARPLIEAIRRDQPQAMILLTFFSPSGYEVRKNYDAVDCVAYLPCDTPAAARQLVELVKPQCTVFVKYEFWGNILSEVHRRGKPLYLISAIFRSSQIFFKPWGGAFRRMLSFFTHIFVQDQASKQMLAQIGIHDVTVAGDTRLDRVSQIAAGAQPIPRLEKWLANAPFTLAAGSSWPADEDCYLPWLNEHPRVKAIIAPHEFDAARLAKLQSRIKGRSVLWTQLGADGDIPEDAQVVIVDCFGLLSRLYAYCDAAIVGGALGAGLHNINEAAVYGVPVAFGPNHRKFREAHDMLTAGAAKVYANPAQCAMILTKWLDDGAHRVQAGNSARNYIAANVGATDKILSHIL